MNCSFKSCKLKPIAKGFCMGHYTQYRKGQKLRPLYNHMSLEERILEHMRVEGDHWIWDYRTDSHGYPQMKYKGGQVLVHRAFYGCRVRPLAKHETLDHECRVRTCINPAHLTPVSGNENTKRMRLARYYEAEIDRLRSLLLASGIDPDQGERRANISFGADV